MKTSKWAGWILGGSAFALVGCGEGPPSVDHAPKAENSAAPPKLSTPVPPVEPSLLPPMPSPTGTAAPEKKAEEPAKVEPEKKAEDPTKAETPK